MPADAAARPRPLPLFPLGTVLFPGARLSLRVFEARYLDLVSASLREGTEFGVLRLKKGAEVGPDAPGIELESIGTLTRIDEVDAEQNGILRVRCSGGARFRCLSPPAQQPDGLWTCEATALPEDDPQLPAPAMLATVRALAGAIQRLADEGRSPFAEPYRLDDAGWVAYRWCELLPLPAPARQKLIEIDDPAIRLAVVDALLRERKVVVD